MWHSTQSFHLNARYYDPSIGRFITEDPIRAGINWYTYCGNNPLSFIDPAGLDVGSPGMDATPHYNEIINSRKQISGYDNSYDKYWNERPDKSYNQTDLYGGGNGACHFWSLAYFAQSASKKNFTRFEWLKMYYEAIREGAISYDYAVNRFASNGNSARDTVLQIAFGEAGLVGLNPHYGLSEDGQKGVVLRGKWGPHNLILPGDNEAQENYHFEAGDENDVLLADPWGHRLKDYAPYSEYYRIYWDSNP